MSQPGKENIINIPVLSTFMKAEARFDLVCLAFSDSDSDLFIKYRNKKSKPERTEKVKSMKKKKQKMNKDEVRSCLFLLLLMYFFYFMIL